MSDGDSESIPLPPMLAEDSEATLYKYRDFASVPEDHEAEAAPAQANRSLESSIRVQKFPVKLYSILAQKEFSDIITWMPHGRSWKVLKPNLFESLVMPLFFEYSNYHSFNRLVNAWSFRRISSGPDRGSYYHELFLRGKPHLQKYMRRLPKTHKKLPMKKQDEPDFYKLDKASPLPELEESQNGVNSNAMALRRPGAGTGGLSGGMPGGMQGGLSGGMPGGMPGGLSGGLSGMQSQMGQLGGPHSGGMPQGGGGYGFNKAGMMGGKDAMNNMNAMLGGDHLRSPGMNGASGLPPGFPGAPGIGGRGPGADGLGGGGGAGGAPPGTDNQLFQLQRLRHLQHLQLFQRQIGASSLGPEDLARIQAEHALGFRGRP